MIEKLLPMLERMAHRPVRNYVTPGLTSELVGGDGFGRVRLFSSDRDTREWITPHSHRFDFVCLVLAGEVENILFQRGCGTGSNDFSIGRVVPVAGGLGRYEVVRDTSTWSSWVEHVAKYKAGDAYSMKSAEIHSIRFSRGAQVLFLEGPETTRESVFLEPFSNTKTVPTFETRSWMFEREHATPAAGVEGEP